MPTGSENCLQILQTFSRLNEGNIYHHFWRVTVIKFVEILVLPISEDVDASTGSDAIGEICGIPRDDEVFLQAQGKVTEWLCEWRRDVIVCADILFNYSKIL